MSSVVDRLFLETTVEFAERGLFTCAPNPRVGCLLVRDGQVLGRGAHLWRGEAHAEINALRDADTEVKGATAYVSLEPCSIHGETPPCADALIDAGITRVVAPMVDPNPRVNGDGFDRLKNAGVQVDVNDLPEAKELNRGWIKRMQTGRPWVRIKIAHSFDGRTAMSSGESQWITGALARADGQYWRARSCAVITGAGTVRTDDPRLDVREQNYAANGRLRQPLRVVVDSAGKLARDAAILRGDGNVLIACGKHGAAHHPDAEVYRQYGEVVDIGALLDHLGELKCNEVLVEAGPTLAGAFIAENLWDELILYLAPKLMGMDARPLVNLQLSNMADVVEGRIVNSKMFGEDRRFIVRRQCRETTKEDEK